jgi:RNA polymerase sigma factor (TIGR02999 family)
MIVPSDLSNAPIRSAVRSEPPQPEAPGTAGQLVQLFYPELRKIAAIRMAGERINHTWQPTTLVNELYLQLTRMKALPAANLGEEQQKAEFLGLSAFLMRRLLIHHARPRQTRAKLRLDEVRMVDTGSSAVQASTLQEIEDLLNRLGAIDPVLRAVVEMKVFEGLNREEIAERLECSVRTVARHWEFAQNWLREKIGAAWGV